MLVILHVHVDLHLGRGDLKGLDAASAEDVGLATDTGEVGHASLVDGGGEARRARVRRCGNVKAGEVARRLDAGSLECGNLSGSAATGEHRLDLLGLG